MLTGHGVYGEYLLRIRWEETSICHHCEEDEDTAQHKLEFCPACAEPRRALRLDIGERLATEAVLKAMLRGRQEFIAVHSYCEQVMLVKERAESMSDSSRTSQQRNSIHRCRRRRHPRSVRPGNVALGSVALPLSGPTHIRTPPFNVNAEIDDSRHLGKTSQETPGAPLPKRQEDHRGVLLVGSTRAIACSLTDMMTAILAISKGDNWKRGDQRSICRDAVVSGSRGTRALKKLLGKE